MSKLLYTITERTQVGIWDCTQVARVYEDRTVATMPYVKWAGNTGNYAEYKVRITGQQHDNIRAALEDGAETTAWRVIEDVAYGYR